MAFADPAPRRQLRLPLLRATPSGREAFAVGPSNAAAVAALDAWPNGVGGGLALVGPEGAGKSHLAADWAERVGAVALLGAEAALADLSQLEGRRVLLDQAEAVDDETLFHLLNLAALPGGALLLAARTAPVAWRVSLPDLRSRLDALRVVTLGPPDDAVFTAMLRRQFEARAIRPSDELLAYLVRRLERSGRAAREAVERLDAHAGERPVTRALARALFDQGEESGELFG